MTIGQTRLLLCAVLALLGASALVGWALDITVLKSMLPGMPEMKANTAICFLLVGIGLAAAVHDDRRNVTIASICGAVVALIGALTLTEYVTGRNFGIDEIIWRDHDFLYPAGIAGRMSPLTASAWLALGPAMLFLANKHDRRFIILAHLLASFSGFMAFLAAAGYAFGAEAFWGIGYYTKIAVQTALGLLIAAGAALMTRAREGWLRGFDHSPSAGALLTKLLPVAFILPVSLGLLLLLGSGLGAYNAAFGFALFAPITTLALIWVVLRVAATARTNDEILRERELQLAAFVEQGTAGFGQVDLTGAFTLVNDRFCEIAGRTREELLGLTLQAITHPDDLPRNMVMFNRAVADGTPYAHEKRYIRPDGSLVWVNNSVSVIRKPSGEPYGVLAICLDVTERRLVEAAVVENERRLRALTDNLPGGMVFQLITDAEGPGRRFAYASQSCLKLTGYTAESIMADASLGYDLLLPEYREALAEAEKEASRTRSSLDFQMQFRRVDGALRWGRLISAPREGPNGGSIWDGIMIDISEQKEAETWLVAMNETLEQRISERTAERDHAWRYTQDMLVTIDFAGTLKAVNPAWTSMLGYSQAESVGSSFTHFIYPDDKKSTIAAFEESGGTLTNYENRYRHKDGSVRWISWRTAPEGDFVYASGRDVTREKEAAEDLARTQEALRQSQKMEAMGQLTGGVAHDFNNLLSPIIGSLDLVQRRHQGDARMTRLIEGALTSAERAKMLVQRLLAFARRQPLQTTAVDIAELVEGMSALLASTLGPGLRLDIDLAPGLAAAKADANQLEMALLNLAVNARDAMPAGGVLTIGAAAHHQKTEDNDLLPGDYIRLWVRDTGIGMDDETLKRSVEPFFSTKGLGRGTGLGLSMVHGLAAQLGGGLDLHSEPGGGTTVALLLPCADEAASAASDKAPERTELASGTILLVEDDELVRASTAEMLSDLGYQIVESASATQALRELRKGLQPDIVVTDHLMPGMTGVELAHMLREERPGLPVLIISGYADVDGIASDLHRLAKPFRQADLAAALKTVHSEMATRG